MKHKIIEDHKNKFRKLVNLFQFVTALNCENALEYLNNAIDNIE